MLNLLLVTLLGTSVCLVLGEALARFWVRHRGRVFLSLPRMRALYRIHPALSPALPSPIRYTVNEHGARGPWLRRAPGCYRVTLIGGSAAEAGLLDDAQCLGGAIHKLLNASDMLRRLNAPSAYVQVLAKSLMDSTALLDMTRTILPSLPRQNAVIVLSGLSDIVRWLEAGAPSGQPAPPPPRRDYLAQYPEMHFSLKFGAVRHLSRRASFEWLGRTVHPEVGGYAQREKDQRRVAEVIPELASDPSGALARYESKLRELLEMCRRQADTVVVGTQGFLAIGAVPVEHHGVLWQGRLGPLTGTRPPRYLSLLEIQRLFSLVNQTTRTTARALDVRCADLELVKPTVENYYDDAHFTPAGAMRAATLLVAALRAAIGSASDQPER